MEANDLCFEPVLLKVGLAAFGIGFMIALDGMSIVLCVAFMARVLVVFGRYGWETHAFATVNATDAADPVEGNPE